MSRFVILFRVKQPLLHVLCIFLESYTLEQGDNLSPLPVMCVAVYTDITYLQFNAGPFFFNILTVPCIGSGISATHWWTVWWLQQYSSPKIQFLIYEPNQFLRQVHYFNSCQYSTKIDPFTPVSQFFPTMCIVNKVVYWICLRMHKHE